MMPTMRAVKLWACTGGGFPLFIKIPRFLVRICSVTAFLEVRAVFDHQSRLDNQSADENRAPAARRCESPRRRVFRRSLAEVELSRVCEGAAYVAESFARLTSASLRQDLK